MTPNRRQKIKEKIKNFINNHGTTITSANISHKVLIRTANSSEMKNYLDDIEVMAVIKPGIIITMSYDENLSENNTFTLSGRSYTIRKITPVFFEEKIIFKTSVAY